MQKIITVPASKTPTTVTIDIADPIVQITQTGGTPIPVDPPPIDPVPVPTPINIVVPAMDVKEHPGSGMEQWHDRNDVTGVSGTGDIYARSGLEAVRFYVGETFTVPETFKSYLAEVKRRGAKFSFGVMTVYEDIGNATPQFILNKITKWGNNIPNPNDPIYLAWILDFNIKLNAWIYANNYQDQIGSIDIRHYGNWGEWHLGGLVDNVSQVPASMRLTAASGIAIVNAYLKAFPNFQLVAMIAAHDRNRLQNTMVDPAISDYILKASNTRGRIGIRRDHVGIGEGYMTYYMGQDGVKDVWKSAPVTGEPGGWSNYPNYYNEVATYHHASVGNGNYGGSIPSDAVKKAAAVMGFHVRLNGGSITGTDTALKVLLNLTADGLVPMYEDWDLVYDFGDKGVIKSSWEPRLFLGTYSLSGALTPPAGWTTLTLRLVCAGRPSLLNLKVR